MIINAPEINYKNDEIVFSTKVNFTGLDKELWYSLDKEFDYLVSSRVDTALLALLVPAMAEGEDIKINGDLSEELYYNLSGKVQDVLCIIIPTLQKIKIYPSSLKSETEQALGVATGFSGGIDSFGALADHFYNKISPSFKLTHLLFHNVGSHGSGSAGYELFKKRYENLKKHPEKIGLPFVAVNSNMDTFYKKSLGFQRTHTLRNTAVALLLQKGIGKYLYASTYEYKDVFVGKTYDISYSDPILLPLVSNEIMKAISVGSEYSRVQKTRIISEITDTYGFLDVCTNSKSRSKQNCGFCWKCNRTILTLEIAGKADLYEDVFDFKAYNKGKRRSNFIAVVLSSKDPLLREIAEYAKEVNFKFPIYSRILAKTGPESLDLLKKLKRNVIFKK